jgi:hypothetical protein
MELVELSALFALLVRFDDSTDPGSE